MSVQTRGIADATVFAVFSWIVLKAILTLRRTGTTRLRGPRNISIIFGFYRYIQEQDNPGILYAKWVEEYGPAFAVAGPFGSQRIMICDPKANAHFYARETYGYVQTNLAHTFIENLVCGHWHSETYTLMT